MDIGPIQALEITDKGFKAGMKKDKKTEILGKINSILNKLTLDKFDVLKDQLVTVIKENIGTADDLNEVPTSSADCVRFEVLMWFYLISLGGW